MTLNEAIASLAGKSDLTAQDALTLRRVVFADEAVIDPFEADALFDLNAQAVSVAREWRDFFAEAITDYVVRQQIPAGYVSDSQANWLIASCLRHGRLREDELDALVHVIEAADQSPPQLTDFIMSALKDLALWRIAHEKRLTASDIARIKRLLFAAGGPGNIGVTQAEAEILFDINDALGDAQVDASWATLFVSAIANSVLFQTTWGPNAKRALQQEAWVKDLDSDPMDRLRETTSFAQSMQDGFKSMMTWDFSSQVWNDKVKADLAAQNQAEVLTESEAVWLFDRLGRNGQFDANEQSLVSFIQRNARTLSPSFQDRLNALTASST